MPRNILQLNVGRRYTKIAIAKTDVLSNIELKNSNVRYPGMGEMVVEKIRSRGLCGRVILSSFNYFSVLECKRLAPEIACGFLTDCWLIDAGAYTKQHGMNAFTPSITA